PRYTLDDDIKSINNAERPIMTPFVFPFRTRLAMYIVLPKNAAEPIACPLGKLKPEISIRRKSVGRSLSNIFFNKGFNVLDKLIAIAKNNASMFSFLSIK